ncbi:hypothetical protein CLV24_11652 [Pontibacter ummariensis]|uniref:Uncharacterized protein n=1 Tax=Pontibacter ummariensis TaxID=1610492 RepID=A0A239I978_9BACT|nr:hypothetical protein [Pontibacter ummariensis]PRY09984.1 hypothetical protein CLV24_11652 [Pontibacter ummariensis]SNS89952.1 hypothetical protein SAMN06296052_11647 [Pontibacter ummariensis]
MIPREVTDEAGTTWKCVQAYAGGLTDEETKMAATKLAERTDGTVPVVCTPTGGEQSVRLKLPKDWRAQLPDEELVSRISAAQSNNGAET